MHVKCSFYTSSIINYIITHKLRRKKLVMNNTIHLIVIEDSERKNHQIQFKSLYLYIRSNLLNNFVNEI